MRDRLADINRPENVDVEAGGASRAPPPVAAATAAPNGGGAVGSDMLQRFQREIGAIDTAMEKIAQSLQHVETEFYSPAGLQSGGLAKSTNVLGQCEAKCGAIRTRLKRLGEENHAMAEAKLESPAEVRIRVQQQQRCASAFMAVAQRVEGVQATHKRLASDALVAQVRSYNPALEEEQLRRAIEEDRFDELVSAPQLAAHRSELTERLGDLRTRNRDIQSLEASIQQLHQMFLDMSLVVKNQGELLNQVEYNVTEGKRKAGKAVENVEEARTLQLKARRKKIIIAVVVLLIILIIVAIVLGTVLPKVLNNKSSNN